MATYNGPIQHVVVVMLENRSYDNVLGALYLGGQAPFGQGGLNGLSTSESNPNPSDPSGPPILVGNQTEAKQIGGTGPAYAPTTLPMVDPGEYFTDMAQQFLNEVPTANPYGDGDYVPSTCPPQMQGFTTNYANLSQDAPPTQNVSDVMNYFTPAQLPVTAFLARNFAVCDRWFASAPTQTYTNRAFALTAAPAVHHEVDGHDFSLIDDSEYVTDTFVEMPSLLQQLDTVCGSSQVNWKVYFHDYSIAMQTVTYVATQGQSSSNVNVSTFDTADWGTDGPVTSAAGANQLGAFPNTFVQDLAAGWLPAFSFIEPRYFDNVATNHLPPNSNHPGAANILTLQEIADQDGNPVTATNPPIDAATGEAFLMAVYNMLRQHDTIWNSTLLIVTYDEHGGTFDHVPPPLALPCGTINWGPTPPQNFSTLPTCDYETAKGFDFNVFGGRVPAIIVSPYIIPGSAIPPELFVADGTTSQPFFDHTTIVKTVWDIFNLSAPPSTTSSLNDRDAAAPSLAPFLSATTVNPTGVLTGVVVAGPLSSVISYSTSDGSLSPSSASRFFASAGPSVPLTFTISEDWLTVAADTLADPLYAMSIVNANLPAGDGPFTATIAITATGASTSQTITVSLSVT